MYSVVQTAIVCGIDSRMIAVEVDMSSGMPLFSMVGFLASEVKESKDRVRTALKNCGYDLPVKRITVNFSPADIKKSGAGFDLPVAVAMLCAMEVIAEDKVKDTLFVGELSLEGKVIGVKGVLSMVICAKEAGCTCCVVSKENEREAALIPGITVIGVSHLRELLLFMETGERLEEKTRTESSDAEKLSAEMTHDFSEINGQKLLRRACEVAISGMHNMLMVGPPGAGKTMVAKCIPSILPPMTIGEQMELSKIYSVCGLFSQREALLHQRPFRNPHHTVTEQGLIGGGRDPKPGEISLAHGGVLFLDELTEFKKSTLEVLRQPLEDKQVTIARVNGTYTFPADVVLVSAMNPCSCGYFPDRTRCRCSDAMIQRYLNKLSQPFLDRMDLCVEVAAVSYEELHGGKEQNESSETIRKRVTHIHRLQRERYEGRGFLFNSQIPANELQEFCALGKDEARFMEKMFYQRNLTARTYHKLLRVARTIADMDGAESIRQKHLLEALCYRGMEKEDWGCM